MTKRDVDWAEGTVGTVFLAFREECIWLRNCYNTYCHLFEGSEESSNALRKAAAQFFTDLNRILIEYIVLQVCKITDPAESFGHPNLTVAQLDARLQQTGLMTSQILRHSQGIVSYRAIVNDMRNKLVSHLDLATVLGGKTLGAHAAGRVHEFFEDIQQYCDEVGRATGIGPLDFRTQAGAGDVVDLIMRLRET